MTLFRLLVPAAGRSQRFWDEGWRVPKPDLVLRNPAGTVLSMIDHALSTIPVSVVGPVVVGARHDLLGPSRPHLRVGVDHSRGQADTLRRLVEQACLPDTPILVMNADMVFRRHDIECVLKLITHDGCDSGIAVHESDSESYSYVNSFPYARKFSEKKIISRYAMSGIWAFRRTDALLERLHHVSVEMIEPYLSHALNRLPGVHGCHLVNRTDFVDLGTPAAVHEAGWEIVSEKEAAADRHE